MRRTKQGIILEQLLHSMKGRYVFCWNNNADEWGAYDCGCCITYVGGDNPEIFDMCGCVCHHRIEEMANGPHMRMFLLALKASEEMPFVPKDYEDWISHCRPIKEEHDKWRAAGNPSASPENPEKCCESCALIIQQDKTYEEHKANPQAIHGTRISPQECHICHEGLKQEPVRKACSCEAPTMEGDPGYTCPDCQAEYDAKKSGSPQG